MAGRSKLFLTKTHTALQNLQRRIDNPGPSSDFISIDSFTKRVNLPDYDIIFVDECSTIDNRTMSIFLEKMNSGTFLVLAGDIYQIESIDFGLKAMVPILSCTILGEHKIKHLSTFGMQFETKKI